MRLIGTLPTQDAARVLADHLLTLGITTRLIPEKEGYGIWVHNEDRLSQARQELETYRRNPDDPLYHQAETNAETVRRQELEKDRAFRRNYRSLSGSWSQPNLRRRPVTVAVTAVCVVVYLLMNSSGPGTLWVYRHLPFTTLPVEIAGPGGNPDCLDGLRHGELWRLITPIFLHFNAMHILFNLWMWISVGTVVEYRRGTAMLAALVLLSAVASNVGEYVYEVWRFGSPHLFGGLSGVDYALFGYVWMLGRHDPSSGMMLHPNSVRWMLLWLALGFTGMLGPIANAAHLVGLVVGVLFGLARF